MTRELTGRHVLIIAFCAFGVIIAANLTMLFSATGTFPGLVVKNAYVASQGWNDRVAAQKALGWEAAVRRDGEAIVIILTNREGHEVRAPGLTARIGRPTTDAQDQMLDLTFRDGVYRTTATLAPGAWNVELVVEGETPFRKTVSLFVAEPT